MIEILQYEFFRNALIAGLLASVACGIMGTYVVIKKVASISGSISHAAFGGIGLGYFLGANPIMGAIAFSLASALGIGIASRRAKQYVDTLIGAMWATGMALGILFIAWTPGYAPDLLGYLFGNILFVPLSDLSMMLVLDMLIVGAVLFLYQTFLAICFDEEFATIMGVSVDRAFIALLCLIALTVVMLIRVVGVILVIALLTIPAAIARQYSDNIRIIMLISIVLGCIFTFAGMWVSYLTNAPSGATIVIIGAAVYGVSLAVKTVGGFRKPVLR